MKRFLSVILALLMLLSLGACAQKRTSKKARSRGGATATETSTTTETSTNTEATTPTEGEHTAPTHSSSQSDEIAFGTLTGNSYENEYFGFGINIPSGWDRDSLEEMAEKNSVDTYTLKNDIASIIADNGYVNAFYAEESATSNTIMISFWESNGFSEDEHLDNLLEAYIETAEEFDYEIVETQSDTVVVDGRELNYIGITNESGDDSLTMVAFCIVNGDYMTYIEFGAKDIDAFGTVGEYLYTL